MLLSVCAAMTPVRVVVGAYSDMRTFSALTSSGCRSTASCFWQAAAGSIKQSESTARLVLDEGRDLVFKAPPGKTSAMLISLVLASMSAPKSLQPKVTLPLCALQWPPGRVGRNDLQSQFGEGSTTDVLSISEEGTQAIPARFEVQSGALGQNMGTGLADPMLR